MSQFQKPAPISSETLMAFMKERGLRGDCPKCPKTGWSIMETDAARGVAMSVIQGDGSIGGSIFPIVPLICRNCGYVWPIARQTIQEWMESRGQDGAAV